MWKTEHRRAADRRGMRYPSDLTDADRLLVEPMIPAAKHGGRKRTVDVREVLNGIFYVLATGCQWNAVPTDLPPKSTIYDYLDLWDWDGTLERIHHALYVAVREQEGREASPTTAIIDSQTAKGAQKRGAWLDPSGYDAGKKIKGRKRHILVDTLGLLLSIVVHPADIQEPRRGLPAAAQCSFPSMETSRVHHALRRRSEPTPCFTHPRSEKYHVRSCGRYGPRVIQDLSTPPNARRSDFP